MAKYLVGLQTIQTGASKQGDQVIKYQLGSHLIRPGNSEEREEVEQKRLARVDPDAAQESAEKYGGNTMSLLVAGVMDTSVPLSEFLEALWIQNALIAYNAQESDQKDEVFLGAYEISTPKPDSPALNLLLYYRQSEQAKMERLAASVQAKTLPGMMAMEQDGIAMAGQLLPTEKVKRRVTSDRDYLYGQNSVWGAFAIKVRFPRSNEFKGYKDGGACLGIHLDDMSAISFERMVKLITAIRAVGLHEAEQAVFHEKLFENQRQLKAFEQSLTHPSDRQLRDIVSDVLAILHIQTIYDRKLARSRDFWKKVKGI